MSNWFNPANPKWRRGVTILTFYSCSLVSVQVLTADYGSQQHVFSSFQSFYNEKVDKYYGITTAELDITTNKVEEDKRKKEEARKPMFKMQRIDTKSEKDKS